MTNKDEGLNADGFQEAEVEIILEDSGTWGDPKIKESQKTLEKANQDRLEKFGKLIEGAPRATEEQRRKRIEKFEMYKRFVKWLIIAGLACTLLISGKIGTWLILGGMLLMAICQMGIKMNMTAQMQEEYEREKLNKERKTYGLQQKFNYAETGNIANELFNAANARQPETEDEKSKKKVKKGKKNEKNEKEDNR